MAFPFEDEENDLGLHFSNDYIGRTFLLLYTELDHTEEIISRFPPSPTAIPPMNQQGNWRVAVSTLPLASEREAGKS